jgi:hypothetical protein
MDALLSKLGIKQDQVKVNVTTRTKGKDSGDSAKQRDVREKMNVTFLGNATLIGATYYEPSYARDDNNRILLDKKGNKVIEHYTPKNLNGHYLIEDNGDGTHTATKFNVYKETYMIDSESMQVTKKS